MCINHKIKKLFLKLRKSQNLNFPQKHKPFNCITENQGVYVIAEDNGEVLHVGRTRGGKNGIKQRLQNHLHGASSFSKKYLKKKNISLRESNYTYQYLEIEDARDRALLEAFAIAILCPKHLGVG